VRVIFLGRLKDLKVELFHLRSSLDRSSFHNVFLEAFSTNGPTYLDGRDAF
jgi:hypothetical protein